MPLKEFILSWLQGVDDQAEDVVGSAPEIPDGEDENEESDPTDLLTYRKLIFMSPAYKWLLEKLYREIHLATAEANTLNGIRQRIISSLPTSHSMSRKHSSELHWVTFELDWDPIRFVREQEYRENAAEAVERAITLTGSANHAQALTCGRYLYQTWPSTGSHTIQLVKDVICSEAGCINMRMSCSLKKRYFFLSGLNFIL